jgi:hypothetical protein
MIVTPTHEQCGEIVANLRAAGFKAVAFPKRTTQGDAANCWNEEADAAEFACVPHCALCPKYSKQSCTVRSL